MKHLKLIGWIICLQLGLNTFAQNPNWTLPPKNYNGGTEAISVLPVSPIIPGTAIQETDPYEAYQGTNAEHTHASYTAPNGELVLFTVDEKVYDKSGWVVGDLETAFSKKGWNERLILPMGNDCNRYAIIYPASAATNESYGSTDDRMRIYMAVYDINGDQAYNQYAIGDLDGQSSGIGPTLTDISNRDCQAESPTYNGIYGCSGFGNPVPQGNYKGNYQIAATDLIDNCFYYVFIFDGSILMRYKLTTNDLEWDDYVEIIPQGGSNGGNQRTEMELIKLSNGDYRIAIPTFSSIGCFISIYTIDNTNYVLDLMSHQQIDLSRDINNISAEMIGLEFDSSGRYLYFTHENNATPQWQNTMLDVYDCNTTSIVTPLLPTLTDIADYQFSFIERFGNTLFLASNDDIAILEDSHIPGSSDWTENALSISTSYKNTGGEAFFGYERSILPEQIDMSYPDLTSFSCDCCSDWNSGEEGYVATVSGTWTPTSNPFGTSADVYMKEDLVINPGVDITISNMTFYFSEYAKVVVKKEATNETGAYLNLTNGTVFTADNRCDSESTITSCDENDECDKNRWPGIRVEGNGLLNTQEFNASTPHGRLTVDENSMIEYAEIGAKAGHSEYLFSGGGMIRMFNARVKDCIIGVQFEPFLKASSGNTELYTSSYIHLTHFTTTSDWFGDETPNTFVDVKELSGLNLKGNKYENQIPQFFDLALRGIGVKTQNARVSSNWKCNSTYIICPAADIVRTEYLNLSYGVYGMNSSGNTRTCYDYFSEFQNNYIGVFLNNFINPELMDGDYGVMSLKDSRGIYLLNSTGYTVQNNELSTYLGYSPNSNIGIHVENSGDANNEIYRNFFKNLSRGGVTTKINSEITYVNGVPHYLNGLDWVCNEFASPILQADLYLSGTMSDEQGNCSTAPAGNLFSNGALGHYDLYSTANSLSDITYYHHAGAVPDSWVPNPISQSIAPPLYDYPLSSCAATPYDVRRTCPVKRTFVPENYDEGKSGVDDTASEETIENLTPDMVGETASSYNNQIAEYVAVLDGGQTEVIIEMINSMQSESADSDVSVDVIVEQIENAGSSISSSVIEALFNSNNDALIEFATALIESGAGATLEEAMVKSLKNDLDTYWQKVVTYYMADTVGTISKDDMVVLLQEYEPSSIQKFASIICPQAEQDWIESGNCEFANDLGGLGLPAEVDGALPRSIPEYFESDFFNMPGNTRILNQYYIDNGAIYDPFIADSDLEDIIIDEEKSNSSGDNADNNTSVLVSPNPFNELVTFNITALDLKDQSATIEFYDLVGRKVYAVVLNENQTVVRISGNNLPKGLITYMISVDGVPRDSGKVIRTE